MKHKSFMKGAITGVLTVVLIASGVALAAHPFTDVPEGRFFSDAVDWAYENGVTTGTSETTFEPDRQVTRGENITFTYRYDDLIVQPALADLEAAVPQVHWVWFDDDGSRLGGSEGVTATRGDVGWYTVDFDGVDVTGCSWSAVYRHPPEFLPAGMTDVKIALQQDFDWTTVPFTTITDQIDVYVFDWVQASQDAPVQVQVIC